MNTTSRIDNLSGNPEWPADEPASADFSLQVDAMPVLVHQARVSAMPYNRGYPGYQRSLDQTEIASFAAWDMAGPVEVAVTSSCPIERLAIRPYSAGIVPRIDAQTIRFRLDRPRYLTVEVNGMHRALHLLPSPPLQETPDPRAADVRYFGPGIHDAGTIEMASGQTVFLAPGAVVYGAIRATGAQRIRILGRGILDISRFDRKEAWGGISLQGCRDVQIDGIIIRDPNLYGIVTTSCRDVRISSVKLVGLWRYNSDGIDLLNCQDVTVRDCFVRSFDDSIVIKGCHGWHSYVNAQESVRNILVERCVVWNDWGRSLEIGAETVADEMADITFRDCDLIHNTHIAMDIQNVDRAMVRNVLYEDIRVEMDDEGSRPLIQPDDATPYDRAANTPYAPSLLVLEVVGKSVWAHDTERGNIRSIRVRNIDVRGPGRLRCKVTGLDEAHRVEDVSISGLRLDGRDVKPEELAMKTNEFTRDIRIS